MCAPLPHFFLPFGGGFRLDLMLVDDPTFAKLMAGSEVRSYGGCEIRVAGVLHLIDAQAARIAPRFGAGRG